MESIPRILLGCLAVIMFVPPILYCVSCMFTAYRDAWLCVQERDYSGAFSECSLAAGLLAYAIVFMSILAAIMFKLYSGCAA